MTIERAGATRQGRSIVRHDVSGRIPYSLATLQRDLGNAALQRLLAGGDANALRAVAQRQAIANVAMQHLIPGRATTPTGASPQPSVVGTATVTSAGVNVRANASASSAKLGELLKGDTAEVLGHTRSWLHILHAGRVAYVAGRFVAFVPKPPAPTAAPAGGKPAGVAATPESGGLLSDVLSWGERAGRAVAETGEALWESVLDHLAGDDDAQVEGSTEGAPPGQALEPTPGNAPQPAGELEMLLAKAHLTNEEIARARLLIGEVADGTKRGDLFEQLQAKPEYHSQRDNTSIVDGKRIGDVMCNLTSLAMCLSYLGVANPHPDMQFEDYLEKVRQEKHFGARTTVDGWGKVAGELGVKVEWVSSAPVTEGREWYVAHVLPHLRAGHAVMLSISGHICRLQAVAEMGLIADDPYGYSKLLAGEARKFEKSNKKAAADEHVGEDIVWPWPDVTKHTMRWVAAFER